MNFKKYIVNDMQEAMAKIRTQLGPDAVILGSHPIKKKGLTGMFMKPQLEVMVAYESGARNGTAKPAKPAREEAPAAEPQAAEPAPAEASAGQPPDKLAAMEKRMESISAAVMEIAGKLHGAEGAGRYCKEIQQQYVHLLNQEVEEGIARAIADEAQDITDRRKVEPVDAFAEVVRHRLGEPEGIRLQRFKRIVAVFVGPTGSGKTTTIAKLAARYAIHEKAKVGLITADAYRIAAHEQIKTYADILEVPLKVIYKPQEIEEALAQLEDADIVLIDTPGKSPTDKAHPEEIAEIIKLSGATEVFLSLSASTGYRSCAMVADQYRFIRDYKVLVTKTDEAPTCGMYLNARALTGKPLSYITTGQSVPDDIEVFDAASAAQQLIWKG